MSSEIRKALRERRNLQKKLAKRKNKPVFRRYLSWRFWKFERREYWRKPKGNDSKMRLQIKGYPPIVKVGYGTDAKLRHLHPSGLKPVRVFNVSELDRLNPAEHIVIIASSVGLRKRLQIIEAARAKGFRISNP
jgi:large subunit ribosomal protein L32e